MGARGRATSAGEADFRSRSALRVLAPLLAFLIVMAAAVATRAASGDTGPAVLVFQGGVGLIAIWAVLDGLGRALGRSTYLGVGRGVDRLFGAGQVAAALGLAAALLPNTLELLNAVARLAVG